MRSGRDEFLSLEDAGTMAAESKDDYYTKTETDNSFVSSNQGSENSGKFLAIDSQGNVIAASGSTSSQVIYIGSSAPSDSFYQFWLDTSTPPEYQRVEYVVANGSQYIDLGFNPTNNLYCEIDAQITAGSVSTQQCLLAAYTTTARFALKYGSTNWAALYGTPVNQEYNTSIATGTLGTRRIYSFKNNTFAWGTEATWTPSTLETFTINQTTTFLANHTNDGYSRQVTGTIYEAIISDANANVSFHLVPAYRLADGVIGFYDLEGSICPDTNTPFWISSGSPFTTKGPDVSDGLI